MRESGEGKKSMRIRRIPGRRQKSEREVARQRDDPVFCAPYRGSRADAAYIALYWISQPNFGALVSRWRFWSNRQHLRVRGDTDRMLLMR